VNGLYDCHELPDRILAISHAGDISLLTIDLEMMATRPASAGENNVISAHVFSRTSCSFLGSQSEGVIVVLIVERDAAVEIEVHQVGADDLIDSVFSHEAPLESTVRCFLCNLDHLKRP
jgi:gephyrin